MREERYIEENTGKQKEPGLDDVGGSQPSETSQQTKRKKQHKTTKVKSRECFFKCGREEKARMWLYRVLPNAPKE